MGKGYKFFYRRENVNIHLTIEVSVLFLKKMQIKVLKIFFCPSD